jgi:hypothetical protein
MYLKPSIATIIVLRLGTVELAAAPAPGNLEKAHLHLSVQSALEMSSASAFNDLATSHHFKQRASFSVFHCCQSHNNILSQKQSLSHFYATDF